MSDGVFRLAAPVIGGGNPEPQGKRGRLVFIINELLTGRSQKTVHSGFVDSGLFVIALALNGQKSPSTVWATRSMPVSLPPRFPCTEFPPKPHMPEFAPVPGDRQQKGLHQAFKTVALVPFGKGYGAVFGEDVVEGHGRTPENNGPCYSIPERPKRKSKKRD